MAGGRGGQGAWRWPARQRGIEVAFTKGQREPG